MDPARKVDGRVERGDRTRQQILDAAVDIASVEGLEGLSIGRLALKLEMSKSGLFAAFGSKQDLQLAAVDHAAEIFVEQVVRRAMAAPRGLPRLWSLCESKLEYMQREVFRGGCFFAAASAEFDGRPGPVRERVAGHMKAWVELLVGAVLRARDEGHLQPDVDPAQLAFEIDSLSQGANWAYQLFGDATAFDRARRATKARLDAASAPVARRSGHRVPRRKPAATGR
ncbi:MAG: TetR/AcrR family transcriptional regulator [Myxococcales bacterium]